MTVRRVDDAVLLEDICAVEDAETLMQEIEAGATAIDWAGCTHLHTACLQVILVAALPLRGTPKNPTLSRWLSRDQLSKASALRPDLVPPPPAAHQVEA